MPTTILYNKSDRVVILKAYELPGIRVLPGFNYIDDDVKPYFKTEVAKSLLDGDLAFVKKSLTDEQKEAAQHALDVNNKLNKTKVATAL